MFQKSPFASTSIPPQWGRRGGLSSIKSTYIALNGRLVGVFRLEFPSRQRPLLVSCHDTQRIFSHCSVREPYAPLNGVVFEG